MACGDGCVGEAENLEDYDREEEHRRDEGDIEGFTFKE